MADCVAMENVWTPEEYQRRIQDLNEKIDSLYHEKFTLERKLNILFDSILDKEQIRNLKHDLERTEERANKAIQRAWEAEKKLYEFGIPIPIPVPVNDEAKENETT